MPRYRNQLPQLSGDIFLADGGVETDLIFNRDRDSRIRRAHITAHTAGPSSVVTLRRGFSRAAQSAEHWLHSRHRHVDGASALGREARRD